jgi:hypothetical protein
MASETDLVALLVKGVRSLEPQEQDAVLADLFTRVGVAGPTPAGPVLIPAASVPVAGPFPDAVFARPAGPLQALPVRLPQEQYERLKRWCAEHDYAMATVVRGLVERFLGEQAGAAADPGD